MNPLSLTNSVVKIMRVHCYHGPERKSGVWLSWQGACLWKQTSLIGAWVLSRSVRIFREHFQKGVSRIFWRRRFESILPDFSAAKIRIHSPGLCVRFSIRTCDMLVKLDALSALINRLSPRVSIGDLSQYEKHKYI